MKRKIAWLSLLVGTAILIGGCSSPLESKLPLDVSISMGLIGGADGVTSLRGAQGASFSVPVLISERQGRPLSAAYTVTFTLSADDDPTTGTDYPLGTATVTAGAEAYVDLTVPMAVPNAAYALIAYFAVAANDPGTAFAADDAAFFNVATRPIDIALAANALPDLELEVNADVADTFLPPGSAVPIGFKITNNGYLAVPAATAIVVNAETLDIDKEIGTVTITLAEALLPQESLTGQITMTVPSLDLLAVDQGVDLAEFEIWNELITFEVDPNNAIAEIDAVANQDGFFILSGVVKSDAYVSGIILPAGQSSFKRNTSALGQVTVQVSNAGYTAIDAYAVRLYIDANGDDLFNTGDHVVQEWSAADTPNVAPGPFPYVAPGDKTINLQTTASSLWPDISGTDLPLRAMIYDSSGEYPSRDAETDDNYHHLGTPFGTISLTASLVDLQTVNMISLLDSPLPVAGGNLPLRLSIKNAGTAELSTDFTVAFYMSADAALDPAGDTLLDTRTVTDNLAAGSKANLIIDTLAVPASANGFYTVYALLDSGGVVAEIDDANNRPASADDAFVYLPIGTSIDVRIMYFKPNGATTDRSWIYPYLRRMTPPAANIGGPDWIDALLPGAAYGFYNATLVSGVLYSMYIYANPTDDDYSFRLYPDYVNPANIPASRVPSMLSGQEAYDIENDNEDTPTHLSGATSPWSRWVTGKIGVYRENYDYGNFDLTDYYSFGF